MSTLRQSPALISSPPWRISTPDRRHWFPCLFFLADGSLLEFNSTVDDAIEAIRHEKGAAWLRSVDAGLTWQPFPIPAHHGFPVQLRAGRVRVFSYILWLREDGQLYGMTSDWQPGDAAWSEPKPYRVNIPPPRVRPEGVSGMVLHRSVLGEPDGTLLATLYGHLAGQEKYNAMLIRSQDEGQSWDYVSTIAYDPELPGEGFCEPVLARVADGSLLAVMRTGGGYERKYPMYQARSLDNGQSWSAPENLGVYSVDPELCLMQNGTLACSFGRPTMDIMFSLDGSGYIWGQPTTIFSGSSTCYSGLREVAPGKLLLVYDSNQAGSPWQAHDNQINARYIDVAQ
ncbi:MAG: exo-alpha-sialidase [Caldilineaceae bacterium]|nr:exo-alpha-sialidase [Caldilineaceae bacterium]